MTAETQTTRHPLSAVADLLREAQKENMTPVHGPLGLGTVTLTERQMSINDKLAQARILVDVLRGDGQ